MNPVKLSAKTLPVTTQRQSGTVLIVALILLLVLTMLGVTALNTSTLEERMAANTQEQNRAFQAAESGLADAFGDPNAFNLTAIFNNSTELLAGGPTFDAGANFATSFVSTSPPPIGSLYSAVNFSAFHFETQSTAFSEMTDPGGGAPLNVGSNAASVVLIGGAFQIGPKL